MRSVLLLLLTLGALVFFNQCKKNTVTIPPICHVTDGTDKWGDKWIFTYDINGKLLVDSLIAADGFVGFYTYADSVVSFYYGSFHGSTIFNDSGWPLSTQLSTDSGYFASYNSNGTLKSIVNRNGQTLVDSIIYNGGNIIIARFNAGTQHQSVYSYTYGSDLYKPFNPTYKVFGLSGSLAYYSGNFYTQGFNPQVFSKNVLIRQYIQGIVPEIDYSYQFDNNGNIIYIKYLYHLAGDSSWWNYNYKCK